jgi:NAD-dependent SIR2 family protein deacetylase
MSDKTQKAGDPIESRCTKCRKITNHTIVSMLNDEPAKVECNTCKGQHKYHPPVKRKITTRRRAVDPKVAEQKEWETLRTELEGKQSIAYSMSTACKVGVVINHPKFGLGLVQNNIGPGKVEVLFEDGKKKMRCR